MITEKIKEQITELETELEVIELEIQEKQVREQVVTQTLNYLKKILFESSEEEERKQDGTSYIEVPIEVGRNVTPDFITDDIKFPTLLMKSIEESLLSVKQIAADTGLNPSCISHWKKGDSLPSDKRKTAKVLEDYFGNYGVEGIWYKALTNSLFGVKANELKAARPDVVNVNESFNSFCRGGLFND